MKISNPEADQITISPSPIYAFLNVLPLLIASIVLTLMAIIWMPLLMFGSLCFLFMAWYRYLTLRFTVYYIDAEVLKIKTGFIAKRIDSLELYRVKDHIVTQSFMMRIFRIMTITLLTQDLTSGQVALTGIPLSDLPDQLRDYVQQARIKNRIFEIN